MDCAFDHPECVTARAFWTAVDWSKSTRDIASEYGVSMTQATHWRKRIKDGLKESKFYQKGIFWSKVDWSKQDAELALEHSVNRDKVAYWRRKLQKPESKNRGMPLFEPKHVTRCREKCERARRLYETCCKTYKEVAEKMGVKPSLIQSLINYDKHRARTKAWFAVKDGKIVKNNACMLCGVIPKRINMHHRDYSKPLEVIWVCTKCHGLIHRGYKRNKKYKKLC